MTGVQTCALPICVVQADFTNQDQPIGTLAILGPTRMEYGRIIGMLSHMKHIMETMVKEQNRKGI